MGYDASQTILSAQTFHVLIFIILTDLASSSSNSFILYVPFSCNLCLSEFTL